MERLTETPNPIPSFRALLAVDPVRVRYYQNTRATTARLAGELRSEYITVRRAALLRLVRRLGFATARDVWLQDRAARGVYPSRDSQFRDACQAAAGAVFAGRPRDA